MENSSKGWVRLYRQIEENPLYFLEPFTKAQAWIDLFLNANHSDGKIGIRGNIIPIKRGQIGWSELTMADRWTWSRNKVRRFLKYLETEQQIIQQKTAITSVITITNYERFQSDDTTDDTTERQQKDNRRYTNKNDKNDKNVKKKKSAEAGSAKSEKKSDQNESRTLEEFSKALKKSNRRDLYIIAEWAETIEPDFQTKGQWQEFLKRHLRAAQKLTHFTDKQIITAYEKIKEANFIDKPTLETILKYLT